MLGHEIDTANHFGGQDRYQSHFNAFLNLSSVKSPLDNGQIQLATPVSSPLKNGNSSIKCPLKWSFPL